MIYYASSDLSSFFNVAVCIETVKQSLVCFNAVLGLFHSLYTSAHGERTAKVEMGPPVL